MSSQLTETIIAAAPDGATHWCEASQPHGLFAKFEKGRLWLHYSALDKPNDSWSAHGDYAGIPSHYLPLPTPTTNTDGWQTGLPKVRGVYECRRATSDKVARSFFDGRIFGLLCHEGHSDWQSSKKWAGISTSAEIVSWRLLEADPTAPNSADSGRAVAAHESAPVSDKPASGQPMSQELAGPYARTRDGALCMDVRDSDKRGIRDFVPPPAPVPAGVVPQRVSTLRRAWWWL